MRNGETHAKPAVLLDLDDTILDFKTAESVAVSETFRRLGIAVSDSMTQRYSEINRRQWEKLELGQITRDEVMVSRFELLFRELGLDCSGQEAQNIYEELLGIGHWFMPGAPELLETLSGRYELYIVSNGTVSIQKRRLRSANIGPYFREIFVSERIGYEKPSEKFFQACFARIPDFDPARTVIVGDSLTSDIRGGLNAGICTVWYNYRRRPAREDVVPDHVIHELSELPSLLDKIFG